MIITKAEIILTGAVIGLILLFILTPKRQPDAKLLQDIQKRDDRIAQDSSIEVILNKQLDSLQMVTAHAQASQDSMKKSLKAIEIKYAQKANIVRHLDADSTISLLRSNLTR